MEQNIDGLTIFYFNEQAEFCFWILSRYPTQLARTMQYTPEQDNSFAYCVGSAQRRFYEAVPSPDLDGIVTM